MKQISLSFLTWGNDNQGRFPMSVSAANGGTLEAVANGTVFPHFQAISNELTTPRILLCPNDTARSWASSFTNLADTNISFFIGCEATRAGSSLLSGDRNLTNARSNRSRLVTITPGSPVEWTKDIHGFKGNLAFGDGSVAALENGDSRLRFTGTNRLAMP